MFPTRTTSLHPSSENLQALAQPSGDMPPEFPTRTSSLANALEASGGGELDLPKPTKRTMQYTQVSFDESTGRPDLQRGPLPVPRGVGIGRVNYSDVDLVATHSKGLQRNQMTLREAEREALKEKPYINVRKEGDVDEDSDPGYYTHMRVS